MVAGARAKILHHNNTMMVLQQSECHCESIDYNLTGILYMFIHCLFSPISRQVYGRSVLLLMSKTWKGFPICCHYANLLIAQGRLLVESYSDE